jgi:hypothetical protein
LHPTVLQINRPNPSSFRQKSAAPPPSPRGRRPG